MEMVYCAACAEQMSKEAFSCPKCGNPNAAKPQPSQLPSRVTAGVLALLLGGLGVHKFYCKKVGLGFVYLIFCWTFVPAIIALVEAIICFTQDDRVFWAKQGFTYPGR